MLGGSSPLTRGKLRARSRRNGHDRLIPTHAGKTILVALYQNNETAHPHSRGENDIFGNVDGGRLGSSPLTRGKQVGQSSSMWAPRLIPTHAGKTNQL